MKKAIWCGIGAAAGLGLVVAILNLQAGKESRDGDQVANPPAVEAPTMPSTSTAVLTTGVAETSGTAEVPVALNPQELAVRAMLEGKHPDEWEPALMKLVENADSDTVAALAKALGTETDVQRLMLIGRALNGIGTEESFRVFQGFLNEEKNVSYREHLAGTMLALENFELSGQVLDWMMDQQRMMDYDITMACQEAVGRLATAEVVERILAEHSRTNYNEYMLELMRTSLANSECPEAIDLFRGALENPSGRPTLALQAAAAQALARIGTQEAIDVLIAALEKSTRSPTNDFLVDAVASLHRSTMQAYLQEQFDQATAPNVKYALGRVLAETVPMLKDYSEGPPPGEEPPPPPTLEDEANALPLRMGEGHGEWEPMPQEEPEEDVPLGPGEGGSVIAPGGSGVD